MSDPSKTRQQYADEYIGTSKQGSTFSLSDMCTDADAIKIAELIASNVNDSFKYIYPVSGP